MILRQGVIFLATHIDVPAFDRRHLWVTALVTRQHLASGLVDGANHVDRVAGVVAAGNAIHRGGQHFVGRSFGWEFEGVVHDLGGDGLKFGVGQAAGVVGDAAEVAVEERTRPVEICTYVHF